MPVKTVTHLITGLGKGGAETMLYQVLRHRSDADIRYRVVSMGGGSYYEDKIRELGIEVSVVSVKKHPLTALPRLRQLIKGSDVLCCWMYHANFAGYIVGRSAHIKKIIWNIRHSSLDAGLNKGLTLRINRWCARRGGHVSAVTYNGERARAVHEAAGYSHGNGVVLDNGVDVGEYRHIPEARARLCVQLGIDGSQRLVLSVTKYHPIKDVPTFIRAFRDVRARIPDCAAVLCGGGIDNDNPELAAECRKNGLTPGKDVFLLGMRDDVAALLSACDVYVLHSAGEAFPNTLVQAMACGCLCAATDVGDVRRILDNDECVVSAGDSGAMADAVIRLLEEPAALAEAESERVRARVCADYNISDIVKTYERLF